MEGKVVAKVSSACFVEDDLCSNPSVRNPIGEIISRRALLQAAGAALSVSLLPQAGVAAARVKSGQSRTSSGSTLTFRELQHGDDAEIHVAEGYDARVLLKWGDPLFEHVAAFDPRHATLETQSNQFGYNCDYTAFVPLPPALNGSARGLLCVNHEYTNTNLMFPGIRSLEDLATLALETVDTEMAALGHSVVEIQQSAGVWSVQRDSDYNRRLTAATPMQFSGPAAGHTRLKTSADPSGRHVLGTLNNCGGGVTPWGTVLICEENFNDYFSGDPAKTTEARNHARYGIGGTSRYYPAWAKHHPRFDVEHEPHEPNRFGWVVEFDPRDPKSVPVKRTALGRLKHEGAGIVVNRDGRVIVYCGDDERFDYAYKFVTSRPYEPQRPEANRNLLDDGTLFVAKFSDDGSGNWLPLVYGTGPLTAENQFYSQADVVIEARRAADLVGATPMDRPEDIEISPASGRVYVILTNNKRSAAQTDGPNPRPANEHGHILELIPPSRDGQLDHAATTFRWEVFLRAGDPSSPTDGASYHPDTSANGWFSSPDNGVFDNDGRLWITTDSDHALTGFGDGIYACDVEGPGRALPKLFFRGPRGSEVTGICLSPNGETIFVSVQHPGQEDDSDFQSPSTRWPDFQADMPPRPAVVAITRRGGGKIGQ